MKTYLAAAVVLLGSVGAAFSQTAATPCIDEEFAVTTGSCTNEPGLGLDTNGPGTLDNSETSTIEQPPTPQGMAPLVVPNDPLGNNVGNNPFLGGPVTHPGTGTIGAGGITTPLIQ